MLLPIGSPLSAALVSGTYESTNIRLLEALLSPDNVCFDIGGHYGYYTLCMAKIASRGHVATFEPVPIHAERIRMSVERSGLKRVTVHQVAVADDVGVMSLKMAGTPSGDDSMAFLEAYGGACTDAASQHYPTFTTLDVPTISLDSLESQSPQFIKIDAEGAEVAILQAGRQMFARSQPRLLVEFHSIHAALQCASIMCSLKYRAILLAEKGATLPVLWIHESDHEAAKKIENVVGTPLQTLFDNILSTPWVTPNRSRLG